MPRFFIDEKDISLKSIVIKGTDVNHIKNVLRLKPNDCITLCDGNGNDYNVSISSFDKDKIHTNVISVKKSISEPIVKVELFQGLPKSDKMEYIIQKCVELGINKIYPTITKRTDVKFDNLKALNKKLERWQKISLEAAKQSGRGIVPKIMSPVVFKEAINQASKADLSIILYENEKDTKLRQVLKGKKINNIAVMVGSEGGFEGDEVNEAVASKILPITLGSRILRTETAALAALSIIMYEFGEV